MQQKLLLAAALASSAAAMPWGPGGRWGTVAPPQQTGDVSWAPEQSGMTAMPDFTGRPPWLSAAAPSSTPVADTNTDSDANTDSSDDTDSSSSTMATTFAPEASATPDVSSAPANTTSAANKNQVNRPFPTSAASSPKTTKEASKPSATSAAPSKAAHTSATPVPSSSSNSTGGGYTSSSSGNDYQNQIINHHNIHRANHSASALTWDADLASSANTLAARCNFAHNTTIGGGGYGQNIEAGTEAKDIWQAVSYSWYNEVNSFTYYGQPNPTANFENWGHFSQIVWQDTTSVGCATVECPNGVANGAGTKQMTVCNYKPPGNFGGEYAKNIDKPKGMAPVQSEQVSASS